MQLHLNALLKLDLVGNGTFETVTKSFNFIFIFVDEDKLLFYDAQM